MPYGDREKIRKLRTRSGKGALDQKEAAKGIFQLYCTLIFKKGKVKKLWKRKEFLKMVITGSRNKLSTVIFVLDKIKMDSETRDSDKKTTGIKGDTDVIM